MRKSAAVAAAVVTLGIGVAPAPAQASDYPTSDFSASRSGGRTSGGFIWYNRSVGVQGSVTDLAGGWGGTTVKFEFYVTNWDGVEEIHSESRTASENSERSFNFTIDPATAQLPKFQAITWVSVQVCSANGTACGWKDHFER